VQNQLAKSGGRARHICWCRKLSVLVVPASHNRLADEAGHDDRAGLGLGHHDEQSMPSKHQHKPAQLHVASIAMLVVAPQLLNTRKVASKLTTSSCSNAAVGEKVARRRIEPTNPHRRHGRRGRARSTAFAARELYYLSYLILSYYREGRGRGGPSLCPWPPAPTCTILGAAPTGLGHGEGSSSGRVAETRGELLLEGGPVNSAGARLSRNPPVRRGFGSEQQLRPAPDTHETC